MRISLTEFLSGILIIVILSCRAFALPPEVAVESGAVRLVIDISNGYARLSSMTNKLTGESVDFDTRSRDFLLYTDKGELGCRDFRVTDVFVDAANIYIITESENLAVTEHYEVFESGCIKRSLQLFAKTAIFVERISVADLEIRRMPARHLEHNARFMQYEAGGFFITVEMPMPSRSVSLNKEGLLHTEYEPVRELSSDQRLETVAAVFGAWRGDIREGYEAYRDYTYELSGWRRHAIVKTSSASPPALTAAYDGYKAVDDDPATRWRSQKSAGGSHWLEVEFPQAVTFNTMTALLDNEEFRPILEKPAPFEKCHLQIWTEAGWKDVLVGATIPDQPVHFDEVSAGKVRLLIEGCPGSFSLWDFRLYRDFGSRYIIPDNLCSRFWVDAGVRMPFTYFNTWYIRHPGIGRLQRARGLLTYETVLPQIPLAAQCGMDNFVLDSGWKYQWYGIGLNPKWEIEFPEGEKPFVEAADRAGINLAGWFNFFWLEGDRFNHQWRVVGKNGGLLNQMCLLSGYYDFVKRELLHQIRNSHMKVMKIDGFVPPEECYAANHRHRPGRVRDAGWLAFMDLVQEIRKQYPDWRVGAYTWDGFWVKYSEIVHTYQDHGGLTPGELAPTRAKMNFMHDREMFNEAYWRYLVRNQVEGSTIIQDKTSEWKEELIGNLAGPTRRQISTDLGSFSAEERNWIRLAMDWSRRNAEVLEQIKPFFPNPSVKAPWGLQRNRGLERHLGVDVLESNTLEGYAHILKNEGYIFLFNPTFHGAEYAVPISEETGFTPDAQELAFQTIYPYIESLAGGKLFRFGEHLTGYLPAEKYMVIRVTRHPVPLFIRSSSTAPAADAIRYTVSETIWDSVNLTARAVPSTKRGILQARLVPPPGTVFEELTVNGRPVQPSMNGTYDIQLRVPELGAIKSKVRSQKLGGKRKRITADVSVTGDLLRPNLMLFLMRRLDGKDRMPKASPGDLDFKLFVNGRAVEGVLGETLEKDWETEKEAGWWIFEVPEGRRKFVIDLECKEDVRPVLLYSAVQDSMQVRIVGRYSRTENRTLLTREDPEAFFHDAFPDEREYFPIVDLPWE